MSIPKDSWMFTDLKLRRFINGEASRFSLINHTWFWFLVCVFALVTAAITAKAWY